MDDFKTLWKKMQSMPGEDNVDKIDALLKTMTKEDGAAFLDMIMNEPLTDEEREKMN